MSPTVIQEDGETGRAERARGGAKSGVRRWGRMHLFVCFTVADAFSPTTHSLDSMGLRKQNKQSDGDGVGLGTISI